MANQHGISKFLLCHRFTWYKLSTCFVCFVLPDDRLITGASTHWISFYCAHYGRLACPHWLSNLRFVYDLLRVMIPILPTWLPTLIRFYRSSAVYNYLFFKEGSDSHGLMYRVNGAVSFFYNLAFIYSVQAELRLRPV